MVVVVILQSVLELLTDTVVALEVTIVDTVPGEVAILRILLLSIKLGFTVDTAAVMPILVLVTKTAPVEGFWIIVIMACAKKETS